MSFITHSSPGVYYQELDLSVSVLVLTNTIASCVFASNRGTLARKLTTSRPEQISNYGTPDPTVSFAHDECLAYLTEGDQLINQRVVNGAEFAGSFIINDVSGAGAQRTDYAPFLGDQLLDYTNGSREIFDILLSGDLVTGNKISVSLDGTPVSTNFATDHPTTMAAFTNALSVALQAIAYGGEVQLLPDGAGHAARLVRIYAPYNTDVQVGAAAVTSGASQANISVDNESWLLALFAENPGDWASNATTGVGYTVDQIDAGTPQRVRLNFSSVLTAGMVITPVVNGVQLAPINFATDNNTTMAEIATEVVASLAGEASASLVRVVPTATDDVRSIQVIAPDSVTQLQLSATVSGTSNPPTVRQSLVLNNIPTTNTFRLQVFTRDNVNVPKESFVVCMGQQVDASGYQQNVESVINTSSRKSAYLRAHQNILNPNGAVLNSTNGIIWLAGGDDGLAVTNGQLIQAWEASFSDPEDVVIRLAINGGYTDPSVQQYIDSMCASRQDCFAILDFPSDSQAYDDAQQYRQTMLNINSSWSASYLSDLYIQDVYTNLKRYIPPAGHVAAAYARTDRNRGVWFSPAGFKTGQIYNVLGLRETYKQAHRDVLAACQLNPIINKNNAYVIYNDSTLLNIPGGISALSFISVRRLEILIMVTYNNVLQQDLFDPNDYFTQRTVVQAGNQLLAPIKAGRGLRAYKVNADVSLLDVDQGDLPVQTYIDPQRSVRRILHTAVLTQAGANFDSLIQDFAGSF